jgi:hypothetical protein
MQLKSTLSTLSSAGLLPTVICALLIAFVVGAIGGGYVVWKWQTGKQAIAENKQLTQQVVGVKTGAVQQATSSAAATQRQQAIAQTLEDDRDALRKQATTQAVALATLDSARPDLRTLDLGPEWLRHWNAANGIDSTDATTAGAAGQSAAILSGPAGGDQLDGAGDIAPARPRGAAVSRVPEPAAALDRSEHRMADDRMAVVLPDDSAAADQLAGVH